MPDQPLTPDQEFAGKFQVRRVLGQGGMAVVYLADELKHRRQVALKVLRRELSGSLGPERFRREIETVAPLQHPHLLPVLDSGETDGVLWFTMPYVEGETLRDRMDREHQLPIRDALRICREAAQGLQHAHAKGVIHRDVKPDNILLTTDGTTLVADFGIARALEEGTPSRVLTQAGTVVGTPAYMSPEQVSGERSIDGRTDQYALGVVLYEALAGELPHNASSIQALLAKRMATEAPSIRIFRPTVPPSVDRVLHRALALAPSDRYPSMGAFADALEAASLDAARSIEAPVRAAAPRRTLGLAAALVVGLAVGGGALFAWRRGPATASPASALTARDLRVAVLPFENHGDSSDAYFADGVTDAIRGKLTMLGNLQVIARASSMQYRNTPKTPVQVAEELGVRYLLTGTVRWAKASGAASKVQVSPELVWIGDDGRASDRWQDSFDRDLADVFKVQADIATQVAQSMKVALTGSARTELERAPTTNAQAYDEFLRGEAVRATGAIQPAALRTAYAHYQRAVALDPSFADAWAQLSQLATFILANGAFSDQLRDSAKMGADRAVTLAPTSALAYRARASYHGAYEKDHAGARADLEVARRLAPNDVQTLLALTVQDQTDGKWEDALTQARAAVVLDPRSAVGYGRLTSVLLAQRKYDEARQAAARYHALAPGNLSTTLNIVLAELGRGDLTAARRVIDSAGAEFSRDEVAEYVATYYDLGWVLTEADRERALALGPAAYDNDAGALALVRAQLYALSGRQAEARRWGDSAAAALARDEATRPADPQLHALRGLALAYAGHVTDAIAEADKGVAMGTNDRFYWPYRAHLAARTYLLVGERTKAIDAITRVLATPYFVSPAWLRIDPNFATLKGDARFDALLAGQ